MKNDNKFFITEDEMIRGGEQKKHQTAGIQQNEENSKIEEVEQLDEDENIGDLGERKMEYFKKKCRELLGPSRVNIKMRVNLDGF